MILKQVAVKFPQKFLVVGSLGHGDLAETQLLLYEEFVEKPQRISYLRDLRIIEVFFRFEDYLVELVNTLRCDHELDTWRVIVAYLNFDEVLLVKESCVYGQLISLFPSIISVCIRNWMRLLITKALFSRNLNVSCRLTGPIIVTVIAFNNLAFLLLFLLFFCIVKCISVIFVNAHWACIVLLL